MTFGQKLLSCYLQNKRELPWSNTKDTYKLWLSELILQQTRVEQGLPYYESFVEKFPTVFDLAKADEQQVLKTWQGLGYYSRARNLHFTAQYVAENLNGEFPKTYNELIELKGVGNYTAAAIASFSYERSEEHTSELQSRENLVCRELHSFPTRRSSDLAKADEQQVLKTWQGLGYYSRARNLHFTAQYVAENLNGEFPKTYNELIELKGVGNYTAAAIASFSYE